MLLSSAYVYTFDIIFFLFYINKAVEVHFFMTSLFNASLSFYDAKLFAHNCNIFIPAFGKQRLVINEPHLKSYSKVPFINLSDAIALYTNRVNEKKRSANIFLHFPLYFQYKVQFQNGFIIVGFLNCSWGGGGH